MKNELMMKDQMIADEQAMFKNHLEVEKEKAERVRKQAAKEGFMHGVKTGFPYTIETSYLKNENYGNIIGAKNQTELAETLNNLGVKPNDLFGIQTKKAEITQPDMSKYFSEKGFNTSFNFMKRIKKDNERAREEEMKVTLIRHTDEEKEEVPKSVSFKKSELFGLKKDK